MTVAQFQSALTAAGAQSDDVVVYISLKNNEPAKVTRRVQDDGTACIFIEN